MKDQLQFELDQIEEDFADGLIDRHEADNRYDLAMRHARYEAEEAADEAYDRAMEHHGFGRR